MADQEGKVPPILVCLELLALGASRSEFAGLEYAILGTLFGVLNWLSRYLIAPECALTL